MVMSDTNFTHTDWAQHLYHWSSAPHGQQPHHTASSSTVVTTTTSPTTSAISGTGATAQGSGTMQPGEEKRVGKPARRRSRVSRKAPTTLLNTDTSNFRAMVQQFTGAPLGPPTAYSSLYQPIPGGIGGASVGLGVNHQLQPPAQQEMQFGVQQPQQLFHQLQYQQQQHDQRPSFALGNSNSNSNNNNNNADVYSFLQGFNTNTNSSSNQNTGGFAMDGVPPQATFHN